MKALRSLTLGLFVGAIAASSSACIIVDDSDASLRVINDSDYAVFELYLTEVDNPTWGPNLLGGAPLYPDEEIVITDIRCDYFDALLVDEDQVECRLNSIDLCLNDATWVLRNNTCDIFTAEGDADAGGKGTPAPGGI